MVSFGPPEQLPVLPWPNAGVTQAITPAEARMALGIHVRIQQLSTGTIGKIDGSFYSFACAHVPQTTALN